MNVELTIAIEQLRYRPADRAWFIPVLLEGGSVPDRPIGGGETLRDIQWVDIAENWQNGLQRIFYAVRPQTQKTTLSSQPEGLRGVALVTDLVGSTTFESRDSIDEFNDLLRATVDKHAGKIPNPTINDSTVVSFTSALHAIDCAIEIQRQISQQPAHGARHQLMLRIGLTAGPIKPSDGDTVCGPAVNLAARVCSIAEPGEILATESVYPLSPNSALAWRDRGSVALKGFSERIHIYEVIREKNGVSP